MDAKVDIRKLQFLNDRIAQVTDALNQVRLSVHGLQQPPFGLQPPQGFPPPQLGFLPQLGLSQPPIGYQQQPGFQQQGPYGAGPYGFQHSPYFGGSPFGGGLPYGSLGMQAGLQPPMAGGFGQGIQGFGQGIQGNGQMGWGGGVPSWPPSFGGGLYHSPSELIELRLGEQRATDPNRILQTFPLCLSPASSGTPW